MHVYHLTRSALWGLVSLAALGLALGGCVGPSSEGGDRSAVDGRTAFRFERDAMGTRFRIVLFSERGKEHARLAAEAAFDRVLELEALSSDWRSESELSQLAERMRRCPEAAIRDGMALSPPLEALFTICAEMRTRSGGLFDPAVGSATKLWRRAQRQGEFPSDEVLQGLSARGPVEWYVKAGRLYLDRPAAEAEPGFDLGAVAKGAALDVALGELEARGITAALVEGGGDLLCSDPPPGTQGWQIEMAPGGALDVPNTGRLLVKQVAVATSGSHSRGGEIEDSFRSHLVRPQGAEALGGDGRRVAACVIVARQKTVQAGARADALATVLCLLAPAQRAGFVASAGDFSSRIWTRGSSGVLELLDSPSFDSFVVMSLPSPNPSQP